MSKIFATWARQSVIVCTGCWDVSIDRCMQAPVDPDRTGKNNPPVLLPYKTGHFDFGPSQHGLFVTKMKSIFIMADSLLLSTQGQHGSMLQCPQSQGNKVRENVSGHHTCTYSALVYSAAPTTTTRHVLPALVHSAAPSYMRTCISLCGDNLYIPFDTCCESSVFIVCPMPEDPIKRPALVATLQTHHRQPELKVSTITRGFKSPSPTGDSSPPEAITLTAE